MRQLVILGHPSEKSLNKAIADSYVKGAKDAGFQVREISLSRLKFDPILHEGYNKRQELEKDLVQAQKDIVWADHLVFVYPTWWGSVPALLKGFIDRVFLPGFAFKMKEGKLIPEKLLEGKSARLIVTAGGPRWFYVVMGHSGNRLMRTFTLNFCGIKPVKTTLFGKIKKNMDKKEIKKILKKTEEIGGKKWHN